MSSYPGAFDGLPVNKSDVTSQQTDHPATHNSLAAAINAIQQELGINPSGALATVALAIAAKQSTSEKGVANGYASLDSGGKVPAAQLPTTTGIPAGSVHAWAGAIVPSGYLLCDGSAVSRTGANAALFAAIGTVWGTGDGSTTFNLPDFRGRVLVGVNPGGPALIDALGDNDGRAQTQRNISHRHMTYNTGGLVATGANQVPLQASGSGATSGDSNNTDYPAFGAIQYIIKQ